MINSRVKISRNNILKSLSFQAPAKKESSDSDSDSDSDDEPATKKAAVKPAAKPDDSSDSDESEDEKPKVAAKPTVVAKVLLLTFYSYCLENISPNRKQ